MEELNIKIKSQRFYPSKQFVNEYKQAIENIKSKPVRVYIKLIMCSGFRIGEAMNSYLYLDNENNLILRGIAEKSYSITKHKFGYDSFQQTFAYKPETLNIIFKTKPEVFKSVKMVNILDLDINEIKEYVSESFLAPRWINKELGNPKYYILYKLLKKEFEVNANVYVNRLSEPVPMKVRPSFHFFRKLFSTLHYYYLAERDLTKTVEYMKWSNPTIIFHYTKPFA